MTAGRRPTPTALKVLAGTARPDRMNPAEPKPPELQVGARPPAWLKDKRARRYWRDLVEVLGRARIIAVTDTTALAILAQAFGAWRHWSDFLEVHGTTYETATENGSVMYRARPEVAYHKGAEDRLVTMLREFGMTPAARSRVAALDPGHVDPAEAFISVMGGAR